MPNRKQRRAQKSKARRVAKIVARIPRPSPNRVETFGFNAPVRIQASQGENPQRRFSIVAYSGDPIDQWWLDAPIVADLQGMDLSAGRIPVLYDHNAAGRGVVGQSDSLRIENGQVLVDGFVIPVTEAAQEVVKLADGGFEWQASMGADVRQREFISAGTTVNVNGRDYPGPIYVARRTILREVSFVVLGADRRTSAVIARRIEGASMTFEEWLVSLGFEDQGASLSEVQKANLKILYDEEYPGTETETTEEETPAPGTEETPPAPVAAARVPATPPVQRTPSNSPPAIQEQRRELGRTTAIQALCANAGNPQIQHENATVFLAAHAIEQGWDLPRVRTQLAAVEGGNRIRASRPTSGPQFISRSHERDCTIQALQGATILRAGGRLDHRAYASPQALGMGIPGWLRANLNADQRQQAMEAAHRYRDFSMVDICRECCRLDGRTISASRSEMIRAAVSGTTFNNVFTTNVNARLLETYMEAPDTFSMWTRQTDVANFKTQERFGLTKGPNLTKHARGGAANHRSRSDKAETYKISRYSAQFQVDEQDIIDDEFGVFNDEPVDMGSASARVAPDLVYAILLANPTLAQTARALFNTTDANLGSSSALASATLRAAIAAMMIVQENGVNLNIKPTHLIVPANLRHLAMELIGSIALAFAGTAGTVTERGTMNPLAQEGLQYVSDGRLDNGVTDPDSGTFYAGSSTTWYLASNQVQNIEVAYLQGTGRAPSAEPFQLTGGAWGMGWKIKIDVGAKAIDWRGLRKTTA